MQCKITRDDNLSFRYARGGLHSVSDLSHLEPKIIVLENILEGLSPWTP